MGTSARAFGTCLLLGCLVQACGAPAPVKESPAPVAEHPREAPKEGRTAEIVIRYCTA